jgi:hypothetical protein
MSEPTTDLPIVHDAADIESVEQLVSALDRSGIRPILISERDFASRSGGPTWVLDEARAVMFAVAMPSPLDFLLKLAETARFTPDGVQRPLFVALLREATERTAQALGADAGDVLDLRSGINDSVIAEFAGRLRQRLDGRPPDVPDIEQMSKRGPLPNEPVRPPPNVPPEPAPTPPTISEIWDALDSGSVEVLAQANAVARSRGASQIHSEDLLIGLYREPDGPTLHILAGAQVSESDVAAMVAEQIPSISPAARLPTEPAPTSPPSLSRHTTAALTWAYGSARATDPVARITTQQLLAGLISLTDCTVAERLRSAGLSAETVLAWRRPEPEVLPEALAGFRSDGTSGKDLLNIGPEVDAIATVLAARSVQPPLALGLFGDWGTGKSFFMDRLERRIDEFARAEAAADRYGDDRVYCRHIVQLKFNAWHYIDQNLWASLANAIFEGLDEALTNRKFKAEDVKERTAQRANLVLEKAQAQQQLDVARDDQAEAERASAEAQAKLDKVDGLYDELVDAVQPGAIATSALKVALDQPEVADAIKDQRDRIDGELVRTARELGINPDTLRDVLAGKSTSGIVAAWRALFRERGRGLWLPIAAIALLAIVLTAVLTAVGLDFAALVGLAGGLVVGVLGPLRPYIQAAQKVSGVVAQARAEGKKLAEEQREAFRRTALDQKAEADRNALEAAATVRKKEADLKTASENLAKLRPGREMAEFVRARQASNVYKSRLGIVAKARDDFEELTRLLVREWPDPDPEQESEDGPKPIERIILYIDDLDRVKEKEVVAVLQAVHLLLAFRLFVVVVAVDPRWLLHSLRVETNVFNADQQGLSDDDEDGFGWESTPLNYLEKIFQIPFALRPMGKDGFGAIVNSLVDFTPESGERASSNGHDAGKPAADPRLQSVDSSGNGATPSDQRPAATHPEPLQEQETGGARSPVATGSLAASNEDAEEARPVVMKPRALEINDHERLFMAQMHPLIGTPRGAKRFVNVYRLLKASHPVAEQGDFVSPKVHRPVLLLLACLTGFPRETAEILRELVEGKPTGSWWKFALDFAGNAGRDAAARKDIRKDAWEQFGAKLAQVRSPETAEMTCDDVRERARRVARYSFESSRILFMEAEDSTTAKPTRKPRTAKAKAPAAKPAATSKA